MRLPSVFQIATWLGIVAQPVQLEATELHDASRDALDAHDEARLEIHESRTRRAVLQLRYQVKTQHSARSKR